MANAEEYAAKIWSCNNRALWFLIWVGLLSLPKYCNRGHEWKFSRNKDGSYIHLHCTAKLDAAFRLEDEDDEEADLKAPVHKRCNYKKSWRDHGFLPYYLPPSVTPRDYLRALYWFCSDAPQKQILKETGLKIKIWNQIRSRVRDLLWLVLQEHAGRVPLGGPGRVVLIDETFFTKKKTTKVVSLGEPHKAIKPLSWGSWSWIWLRVRRRVLAFSSRYRTANRLH